MQPTIEFPPELPVSARRDEIAQAIATHQVVIVSGETGSGKTTQLPKIALALGRGRMNAAPGTRGKLIGHTQPRRIAASSVARRIAEELQTPPGEVVGYKIRFADRLGPNASIKLMTDGILLAETQGDPLLQAYDTLIVDEAHERSLNIDFLLGYLRAILPRRPDLKVIVTSATIDAERFAQHFASAQGPAPVIAVSGRMYPVEVRWRPFEESRDRDLNDAIADAVDELWAGGGRAGPSGSQGGDILVFLPGEREIREAADRLRKHLAHKPALRNAEVLPLFSRLSQAEQEKIFAPHGERRIVLATNVAETSLTVPGIRYVVDSGTARVKRYSFRNKVEQLLVEDISQAAASQRAGRCGRVAEGIAIRLYEESDFASRPRFTDPEILRSSLAGVILRMQSLHLGAVEDFPFLEAPQKRAIADGYQLLQELGAVDDANQLTQLGAELARLPLDPRVGRMLVEARQRGALQEVLVIAAALSVQDVRDRPLEMQTQADQQHAKFDDEKSEFSGYLRLWKWLEEARGGHGKDHKLSNRQYEALLRQNFISVRRVREWRDIHSQLHTVVAEHKWRFNTAPASYEELHKSLLAGLLGNVGVKLDEEEAYQGARGIKFHRHPGAHLKKKPGKWIVAAELVETTRLFARGIANIEPQWIEEVAPHLLRKQLLDPHWEMKAGEAVALERATLYGLVVYSGRRVPYARVDPVAAREIFIREGLVGGQWPSQLPFLVANRKLVRQIEELEHKSRRQDVLVDDELVFAFYDKHLPQDVFDARSMERWHRDAVKSDANLLRLTREELMRHEAAGITTEAFPRTVRLGGVDCAASYLHEPGDARDGVTVTVPLFVLNQVSEERAEWLVPGMLQGKVQALLKSLPQKPRARLVPLPESAAAMTQRLSQPERWTSGALTDALLAEVREATGLDVKRADFKAEMLSPHLFMNFVVVDEHGRQLGSGRNLAALKAELGAKARGAFQALASLKPAAKAVATSVSEEKRPEQRASAGSPAIKTGAIDSSQRHTAWDFGTLPELLEIRKGGQSLVGFPALVDQGDAVTIEVFDEPQLAEAKHRVGLRRLFALQVREALKFLEKNIPDLQRIAAAFLPLGTLEELRTQIVEVALDRAFLVEPLPTDEQDFRRRLEEGKGRLTLIANEVARLAGSVLTEYSAAARKAKESKSAPTRADAQAQLDRLVRKNFIAATPWAALQHLPRYLKAIALRFDKLRADPARDAARMAEIRPLEERFARKLAERKGTPDAKLDEFRWLLEELRVSMFAQELRTPQPVSVKRLEKAWDALAR